MKYRRNLLAVLMAMAFVVMSFTGCSSSVGGDKESPSSTWEQVSPTKDAQNAIDNPQDVIKDSTTTSSDDKNSDKTTDKPTKEPQQEETKASIIMVGDMLLHKAVSDSGEKPDGTYNYDSFFENVKDDIAAADMAMVNEEVILGGTELGLTGYPCFNGAYEVGDAIVKAGFDVVLHATNHSLDKGSKGLNRCIDFWKERYPDIVVTGVHQSAEDQKVIRVKEVNGIKIAILNYTYGTNGIPMPSDMPYAVDMLDDREKIKADIASAKEQADFVMVCPHWGVEYNIGISDEQKQWAQVFADAGADLVIGTHPHVIEPVETVKAADGHETLVYYSLGNFINSTSSSEKNVGYRYVGGMAKVTIKKDADGKASISDYGIEPLVTQNEDGYGKITTYKLKDYTDDMASKNKVKRKQPDFSVQYCKELCTEVFKDLYKE